MGMSTGNGKRHSVLASSCRCGLASARSLRHEEQDLNFLKHVGVHLSTTW